MARITRREFGRRVSAPAAGLVGGAVVISNASGSTLREDDKHVCKGKNECKGQGGCKTGDAGCAGKNSCKRPSLSQEALRDCRLPSIEKLLWLPGRRWE